MDTNLLSKKGSLAGAILLIIGCCIGAGMLGLPVMSALGGFKPSLVMFILSWLYMTTTALLLLEANLWFKEEVSIITIAGTTLGNLGKAVAWGCYVFLFYTLGIAYISGSGELLANFIQTTTTWVIPNFVGSVMISLLFGAFVYLGTHAVDRFNRLLMIGLIFTYLLLVGLGFPHVTKENLSYQNWSLAPLVLPVMIISFGFHNLIPSLTAYLKSDVQKLKKAVIYGSALALIIFLVWEWLILGLIPIQEQQNLMSEINHTNMATEVLSRVAKSSSVAIAAEYFAFFAIVTSFLGNSLSFVDFFADGLKVKKTKINKLWLCILVIIPSFILTLVYPQIFLTALNFAGAFGAVVLFGIIPALIVWRGRYHLDLKGKVLVPGGKGVLSLILLFSISIMIMKIFF